MTPGWIRPLRHAGILVFVLALGVRLEYLREVKDAPIFTAPFVDAQRYDAWALEIAGGDWMGKEVFYQAPLYPYFLAAHYRLLGHDLLAPRVTQAALGATACLLLVLAGATFFTPGAGITAGVLLALYPPAIFFDGLLQKSSLDLFLLSALLFLVARAGSPAGGRGWALAAGTVLGLLALTRENALVLLLVLVPWFLTRPAGKEARPTRAGRVVALLAGLALVLGPVAWRNHRLGGGFQLTTSQLGPNFYMGNNEKASGFYEPLRAFRASPEFERTDSTLLAEAALQRRLSPGEVSRYWLGRALAYIRAHPGDWLRLLARKWFLVWNRVEIADAEDLESYRELSPLLDLLARTLHFGVLAPLAALGVAATWSRRRELWVLHLTILALAGSAALFYVFARYRFPLVPPLALFAGASLPILSALVRLEPPLWRAPLVAWLAAAVVVNWPLLPGYDPRADTEANLGAALVAQGRAAEALPHYERALALRPTFAEAHNNLANALRKLGRADEAIPHYQAALATNPEYASAHANLASLLLAKGDLESAIVHERRAIALSPDLAEAHLGLGQALAARGEHADAIAELERALALKPDLGRATDVHLRLGGLRVKLGDWERAIAHLEEAVRVDPLSVKARLSLALALVGAGDPRLRDPAAALRRVEEAEALPGGHDPAVIAALEAIRKTASAAAPTAPPAPAAVPALPAPPAR